MHLNGGVGDDSWESLGLQGDPTSAFWRRSALGFLWKEWCWSWSYSTLATSCEELTHWKRLWCWEGWRNEEKGVTEDEMAGWHHWLDGRESEWTPGVGDGQGALACCDSLGCKESDTTEQLNWQLLSKMLVIRSIKHIHLLSHTCGGSKSKSKFHLSWIFCKVWMHKGPSFLATFLGL